MVLVITPLVIDAVAVAVPPTPVTTPTGFDIAIDVVEPTYPLPPLVMVNAWIVPPIETVAVNPAATKEVDLTINPPTLETLILPKLCSYLKKDALSRYSILVVNPTSPIIFAVGYTSDSIESLVLYTISPFIFLSTFCFV